MKTYAFVKRMDEGMSEEENIDSSVELKRPLAVRALRRSNVRKKIAEYLFDISPSYSYTSEIAYHVRTTPSNVIGAIRGMQTRYREEESLLRLEIIQEHQCGKNVRLYGITDFGKEMLKTIKDRR
ncbi:MAG: archaellum operon transcriptional activator EarA family protein [Thermoplasmatota archaeon]